MTAVEIIGYVGYIVGGVIIIFSKTKTDNIKDLMDRVKILESDREDARRQHMENQKAISNLEGQLSTYKEIPLKSIAQSLESLPKIVDSNQKILNVLNSSADIASKESHDGGLLVKTKAKE